MPGSFPVVAGTLSTAIFVASTMPMIVKAVRTRDLSSYSGGNLILSNAGNLLYAGYVLSLPVGPVWALYGFNMSVSAAMLTLWVRYRTAQRVRVLTADRGRVRPRGVSGAVTADPGSGRTVPGTVRPDPPPSEWAVA